MAATHASARAGDPDPRFGSAGTLVTEYPGGGMGFTRLKDGKLLFRGMKVTKLQPPYPATQPPVAEPVELVKIDDRGALDTTFGQNGVVKLAEPATFSNTGQLRPLGPGELLDWSASSPLMLSAFKELPDGSLLLLAADEYNSLRLVRLNADGSHDTRYGTAGALRPPPPSPLVFCTVVIEAVAIAEDGTVHLLDGWSCSLSGTTGLAVQRISPQGEVDEQYGRLATQALADLGEKRERLSLQLNASGQLLIGTASTIIRLQTDGSLDRTFAASGVLAVPETNFGGKYGRFLFQRDGAMVASALERDSRIGNTLRLLPGGSRDPGFDIPIANFLRAEGTPAGLCLAREVDALGMYLRPDDTLVSLAYEGKDNCNSGGRQLRVRQFSPGGAPISTLTVDVKDGSAGGVPWEFASPLRHPSADGNAIFLPRATDFTTSQPLARATVTRVLIADDIPAPRAEGAWWAGAAENGWGFSLVQSGNTLAAGWYYYDDAGKPTWAIMPGCTWDASYNVCTGQVTSATGSWLGNYDASKYTPTVIGSATLHFNGAGAGTFEWDIGGKKATKAVTRLAFGSGVAPTTANYTGIWSGGAAQNGWGLALFQQQATIAGAWYTYDNAGKPVWYLINGGGWMPDGSYAAQLVRATGSPLIGATYNAAAFTPQQAGTLTLKFAADGTGTMTYTVDGVTQTKTISRLLF